MQEVISKNIPFFEIALIVYCLFFLLLLFYVVKVYYTPKLWALIPGYRLMIPLDINRLHLSRSLAGRLPYFWIIDFRIFPVNAL